MDTQVNGWTCSLCCIWAEAGQVRRGGAVSVGTGLQSHTQSRDRDSWQAGQCWWGLGGSDLGDGPFLALSDLGLGSPLGPISHQKSRANSTCPPSL